MLKRALLAFALLTVALPVSAADGPAAYTLTIKDHRFEPAELKVKAGEKIKLTVKNLDATAEEFESHDLHREKVIAAGKEITITLQPLEKGIYKFVGEYHEETAKGQIVAE